MKIAYKLLTLALIVFAMTISTVCQNFAKANEKTEKSKLPKIEHFKVVPKHEVLAKDMPKPFASESARRPSKLVPQPDNATLRMPKGFTIDVFAEGEFRYPRWMALAPNGDVFVADPLRRRNDGKRIDRIIVLRDTNNDGKADKRFIWSEKLSQPFGMAFHKDWFYVANTDSVVRFKYKSGQTEAIGEPEKIIELTEGGYRQHWTRNIIFSPKGDKLYVSIGSKGNYQPETDPRRAAINVYNPDGSGHRVFADGLRNPIGLAFNPKNGKLWTAVNERDRLGNDLVPDYVTSVKDGAFYGYPYSYIGKNPEPRLNGARPDLIAKAIVPDVLVTSHSAALGIVFNSGRMFPKEYNGDAFVAFHGSWNRQKLTGYKIIRIDFDKKGNLKGKGYEDFITGWLPSPESREVWGRPVGLLMLRDGSMLIADDGAKKIWRVTYKK